MKIDDYELLLKLYEIGTIRGTAKEILISQPAVSQRLKYIESYFNEKVFIRTQKRLVLTPSGEIILEHAKKVIRREQELKDQLILNDDVIRGTLSIGSSTVISQRFLPNILAKFTKKYPNVSIDLVSGISDEIIRKQDDYHVCIIRGDQLDDANCVRLFTDPLYIFDTEPFPSNKKKKRPLISFNSGDSMNDLVEQWLYEKQDQIEPIQMIQVDQIETCKQFMKEGLGMAVLPLSVSQNLLLDYPNLALKLQNKTVTRDTWICYRPGMKRLPQVAKFIEMLQEETFLEKDKTSKAID